MGNNKNSNKKILKLTAFLISGFLAVVIFIASGFAFASSVKNSGPADNSLNPTIEVNARLDLNDGVEINDAAKSINSTIDFLGINNASVETIDDDMVKFELPISAYNDSSDSLLNTMQNVSTNHLYQVEVEQILLSTLFTGNIEFRTTSGEEIFTKNNDGEIIFNEPTPSDGGETSESRFIDLSEISEPVDLFTGSYVSSINGEPVINLNVKSETTLNKIKEWNNWFNTSDSETSTYVAWIEYDFVDKAASLIDNSYTYGSGLYENFIKDKSYSEIPNWIKPFYITTSTQAPLKNKYESKVQLIGSGNLTTKSANYFSNKINNYDLFTVKSINKIDFLMNEKSIIILIVLASILLIIILIAIFLFSWYFGLLGFIGSLVYLSTMAIIGLIVSTIGITITGIALIVLIISTIISASFFYKALSMYKNDNEDKFMNHWKRFKTKFVSFNGTMFPVAVTFILVSYLSTFFITTILSTTIYLLIIVIVMSYLLSSLILIPLLFGMDYLLNFTFDDINSKWNIVSGVGGNIFNSEKFAIEFNLEKNKAFILTISTIIVGILSILVSGILFATTGNALNSNLYGTRDYEYSVVITDENERIDMSLDISGETSANPGIYDIQTKRNELDDNINPIKDAFKDEGVKVKSIDIVRNDYIEVKSTNIELFSSFGLNIYSNRSMNEEQFNEINETLEPMGYKIAEDKSITGNNDNFSERVINYTNNKSITWIMITIILFILFVGLIMLLFAGWGISLSSMISTLIESTLTIAPIFALFIPYSTLILIPTLIMLFLSSMIKTSIIQRERKIIDKNKSWINASKANALLLPIIGTLMALLSFLLIPIHGVVVSILIILMTVWVTIITSVANLFVFPYYSKILGDFRNRINDNKKKDDIRNAGRDGEPTEEFVDGVNM